MLCHFCRLKYLPDFLLQILVLYVFLEAYCTDLVNELQEANKLMVVRNLNNDNVQTIASPKKVKNNNNTPPAINFPLKLDEAILVAINSFPKMRNTISNEWSFTFIDTGFFLSSVIFSSAVLNCPRHRQ